MWNIKIVKTVVSQASYLVAVAFILVAIQSCSKTDEPELFTFTGQIWRYDGPEIGMYNEIDATYFKPFPDIEVFISSCKPWSGILGGGCTPEGRIEEMDVTDTQGKYSISFRSYNDISYYPQIDYRSDYFQKSEGYSPESYKEIILVPRSLIK